MHGYAINSTTGYYVYPYSLNSLSPSVRRGLIAFSVLGMLSVTLTVGVLFLILLKICKWRDNHRQFIERNQCLILVMNLLFADLHQALSFTISIHWLQVKGIFAPTAYCWAQAGLLHLGDVSSGFFVLTIAFWTFYTVMARQSIRYWIFVSIICFVWLLSISLTIIGPLSHGKEFFALAGNWCWISERYNDDRLWLHYLWVFIDEFGTVLIYLCLWVWLQQRMRISRATGATGKAMNQMMKASRYMLAYAVVYVVLTLPLATARMMALSGHNPPNPYLLVSGALLTSCGWLDALLYTLTRSVLVDEKIKPHESHDNKNISPLGKTHYMQLRLGNDASATGGNMSSKKNYHNGGGNKDDRRTNESLSPTQAVSRETMLPTKTRKGSTFSLFNPKNVSIWRKTSIEVFHSTNRASVESGVLPPELQHYHNWVDPNDA